MPDGLLAPAVSRVRNIGVEGATVSRSNKRSTNQLLYASTPAGVKPLDPRALYLDTPDQLHYVPPSWEPLFMDAGIGFLER